MSPATPGTGARTPGSFSIIPDGHSLDTPPLVAAWASRLEEYFEYRVHDEPISASCSSGTGTSKTGPLTSTTAPGSSSPLSPIPRPGMTTDERMCESMEIRKPVRGSTKR